MKNLKRLGVSVTLMFVLAVVALAGETQSPPCAPPEPGETQSPPCAGAQPSDNSGLLSTPPAPDYLVAEAAINLFESLLPLF